jgi:hypothetical protein
MSRRGFGTVLVCKLAAACCVLTLLSCGRLPSAPGGQLLVYVSQDGTRPAPGKKIEIRGTSFSQFTDETGEALFRLRAGTYVVRAYALGGPGPGFPYVEQNVDVEPARMSRAQFNDCTMCALAIQPNRAQRPPGPGFDLRRAGEVFAAHTANAFAPPVAAR